MGKTKQKKALFKKEEEIVQVDQESEDNEDLNGIDEVALLDSLIGKPDLINNQMTKQLIQQILQDSIGVQTSK